MCSLQPNVVNLAAWKMRKEGQDRLWREVVCRSCGHFWEVSDPAPPEEFRCRECGESGFFRHHAADEVQWICECGGHAFMLLQAGNLECLECGMAAPFAVSPRAARG